MVYGLKDGRLAVVDFKNIPIDLPLVAVFSLGEDRLPLLPDTVPEAVLTAELESVTPRFVSHEALDVICVNQLEYQGTTVTSHPIYIFLQQNRLQFLCEESGPVKQMLEKFTEEDLPRPGFGLLLSEFFRRLLSRDSEHLANLETGLGRLEDEVIENRQKNYTKRIISLRKHLMPLHRNYEALLDIFDGIEANENGLFDGQARKLLKISDGKANRLYQGVQHLRDYVTQIREAYQAEVDINLNKTMKFFTVVTTIFLPLTLIAGWYGMNFDIPEYRSPWGYPVVILVSLLIVGVTVYYFKRKKWF